MTATIHRNARAVETPVARGGETADHTVVRLMMKLRTTAGQADPWPIYQRLRAAGEVVPTIWGGLLVTSYGACDEVLRGRRQWQVPDRVWRARHGGPRWSALSSREFGRTLLALNGYEHARAADRSGGSSTTVSSTGSGTG
jgi:cytochrome P450